MKKLLVFACLILLLSATGANAQNRKSVSAAEASGTFRSFFNGKFKGNYNEIKILALGKGKLRVAFNLTYPFINSMGEQMANIGVADGTATIEGDTAVFSPDENEPCKIKIKFLKRGTIEVTHTGAVSECGFGFNVNADGTYKKTSNAKPKFSVS